MVCQARGEDMKNVSAEIGGFTPIIDAVVSEVGFVPAAVFGVVWRFCQLKDGVCNASLDTIAAKLDISTRTALRHIKALCDAGYIEDTTPELRNRPHVYRDTGKAGIKIKIAGGVTESHTTDIIGMTESHSTMTESHTHYDRESLEETKEETILLYLEWSSA